MNFVDSFDSKLLFDSSIPLGERAGSDSSPGFVHYDNASSTVVVPDAHLLFSGSYMRIGYDLIITEADKKFVVGNYFKSEHRPALSAPDGATLSAHIVETLTGHTQYAQAAGPAPAEIIGHVVKLTGSASVMRNGVAVELHMGDAVQKSDVVQTGADSMLGLTFIDGSAFGMTSNARMVLNEMIYDPNGSSNSSLISLVQGTITFVAGQTAKNGNMRVDTPVATMGIRGTAVLVEIGSQDGPTKFSVLVEPDGHTGSYNLYDKASGQLIGTVSQAGQMTLVTGNGTGQPPSAVEQLKTLQDQQAEKAIIQQVFQMYFPNYTPDNSNPQKFGHVGSSVNALASLELIFTTQDIGNGLIALQHVEVRFAPTNDTPGNFLPPPVLFSAPATFSGSSIVTTQAYSPTIDTFNLGSLVHVENGVPADTQPFVPDSAVLLSVASSIDNVTTDFLKSLIQINETTGEVTLDRQAFNFLGVDQSVTYTIEITSRSGGETAQVQIPVIVVGTNDVPTIVQGPATDVSGGVKDGLAVSSLNYNFGSYTGPALSDIGVITFRDVDLTDTHTVSVAFKSASSTLPGLTPGEHLGYFTVDPITENTGDANNTSSFNWHFVMPADDPILQALGEGQTLTQIYTVTITDQYGASVAQDVTITLTGTNDAPTFTNFVEEYPAPLVLGQEAVGSLGSYDLSDSILVSITTEPTYSVSEDQSSPIKDTIKFQDKDLSDTHHSTASLSGGGVDAIVLGGDLIAVVSSQDPADKLWNDVGFDPATTSLGTFAATVDENTTDNDNIGKINWSFTLDNPLVQQLAAGQWIEQTYIITVTDNHGASATTTVPIYITGENDNAVFSLAEGDSVSGVVTAADCGSNGTDTASGTVSFTDVDWIDTHSVTVAPADQGTLGQLTATIVTDSTYGVTGSIAWTYSVDDALLKSLGAGETKDEVFTISLFDGTSTVTEDVTVALTGVNDAPVVDTHSIQSVSYVEGSSAVVVASSLTVSDVDSPLLHGATIKIANFHDGDALGFQDVNGIHGSFDAHTGILTLTGDASVDQYEAALQSVTFSSTSSCSDERTISFQVDDGSAEHNLSNVATTDVSVSVQPPDHAPIIDTDHVQISNWFGAVVFSGISISDTDNQKGDHYTVDATGNHGFTWLEDGSYTLNGANQALDHGLVYSPNYYSYSPVGKVTLTVTDDQGLSDSVNFVFKQGGFGGAVLTGANNEKDVIFSSSGNDIMSGGAGGHDQFVFNGGFGHDVITDFDVHSDTITINGQAQTLADLLAHATSVNNGQDTLITPYWQDHHDTILLKGVHLQQTQGGGLLA